MLKISTILVPTDFSPSSVQALHVAQSLARDYNSKLLLVAVSPPPPPTTEIFLPNTEYPGRIEAARRELTALAATMTGVRFETHVRSGEPGPAIIEISQDYNADLIVMGTHGRRGISRLLMGSVAEYVMRHARCPVLTIRPGTEWHLQQDQPTPLSSAAPKR